MRPDRKILIAFVSLFLLAALAAGCGDFFTSGNSIATLTLDPTSYLMATGQTVNYKATGTTVNGTTQDETTSAKWTSSNTSVATISVTGVATAVSTGSTTITASSGNGSATGSLIVSSSTLQTIAVSPSTPSVSQTQGTYQFTANGTFSNGTTQNLTSVVQWTSSDTSVATINNTGLATLITGGGKQVTITATVTTSGGAVTGNTQMTVN